MKQAGPNEGREYNSQFMSLTTKTLKIHYFDIEFWHGQRHYEHNIMTELASSSCLLTNSGV